MNERENEEVFDDPSQHTAQPADKPADNQTGAQAQSDGANSDPEPVTQTQTACCGFVEMPADAATGAVEPPGFVYGVLTNSGGVVQDYYWNEIRLRVGDACVVDDGNDKLFGTAAIARRPLTRALCEKKKRRKITRRATVQDVERAESLVAKEKKAMIFCREKILERCLPMSLSRAQYTFDGKKAVFFYTADRRVDFRELVKDLVNHTRVKIEMRQIGVRDEAKMMGGCGPCGGELCCSTFLKDFAPVSIRMAKDQNLSLNPSKISGVCGRLMCCLGYEHKHYKKLQSTSPKLGKPVVTKDGEIGRVCQINLLQERATVVMDDESKQEHNTFDLTPLHLADKEFQIQHQQRRNAPEEGRAAGGSNVKKGRGADVSREKTAPGPDRKAEGRHQKSRRDRPVRRPQEHEQKAPTTTPPESETKNIKADTEQGSETKSSSSRRRRRRRRGRGGKPKPPAGE